MGCSDDAVGSLRLDGAVVAGGVAGGGGVAAVVDTC